MAYTLGNKCAKNLCKRMVLLQLIIENVVTCFFGTQCRITGACKSTKPRVLNNRHKYNKSTQTVQTPTMPLHCRSLVNEHYIV